MTNIMELNQNLFPSGKIEIYPSYSTGIYSLAGNQQITKKRINQNYQIFLSKNEFYLYIDAFDYAFIANVKTKPLKY